MDTWTIVGTAASVFGAVLAIGSAAEAWRQAKKARLSVSQAEAVRRDIVDRHRTAELSEIQVRTNQVLSTVRKLGPSCTEHSIRGVDCQVVANEVHGYAVRVRELSSHFSESGRDSAGDLCDALEAAIRNLAQATTFVEKCSAGGEVNRLIESFLPKVKSHLDQSTKLG